MKHPAIEKLEKQALLDRIAELEEQVEHEKEFPQVEDDYWYVDGDAEVMLAVWYGDDYDKGRVSIENVFKTKEQADFAVEKLKVEAELRKFSRPFEIYGTNYYLYFAKDDGFIGIACLTTSLAQGAIYFESENKAQQAIQSVGEERIKKYLFGVED